jgi:nitrite reductase/ring-hydroxylating ferredoxin subunit
MWEFDCITGESDCDPAWRVPTYQVKVEGDDVLIDLP